jgi:enediyne biosynthesis protein CalE3
VQQRTLTMHQVMLSDTTRVNAYDEALRHTVRPGDVVADVGAGTLILSLLALRHGAEHVYAIEGDPEVAAIAEIIAESNDVKDRVTIIQGDARTARIPTSVDVIVSEMMGYLGPEEEMADVIARVARRHLKRCGTVVPARVVTYLQAIQFHDEGWGVWSENFRGFSMKAVQDHVAGAAQLHFFTKQPVPLSRPVAVTDDRLGTNLQRRVNEVALPIVRSGTLQAVIGYFTATLADGVTLSNHPGYPGCNWAVWVWPLRHTQVQPDMNVTVEITRPSDVRHAEHWRLDCGISRARLDPLRYVSAPADR